MWQLAGKLGSFLFSTHKHLTKKKKKNTQAGDAASLFHAKISGLIWRTDNLSPQGSTAKLAAMKYILEKVLL